jgi:hypothetical protein
MVDGKPGWTALGTWEQIRGSGSLANVQLRGTWTAKPISEKEFVMDWEGTLTEDSKHHRLRAQMLRGLSGLPDVVRLRGQGLGMPEMIEARDRRPRPRPSAAPIHPRSTR